MAFIILERFNWKTDIYSDILQDYNFNLSSYRYAQLWAHKHVEAPCEKIVIPISHRIITDLDIHRALRVITRWQLYCDCKTIVQGSCAPNLGSIHAWRRSASRCTYFCVTASLKCNDEKRPVDVRESSSFSPLLLTDVFASRARNQHRVWHSVNFDT